MSFVVFNSTIIPSDRFSVTADNRIFSYGDGLFESMRAVNGDVVFWEDHWERLSEGMKILRISHEKLDPEAIRKLCVMLIERNGHYLNARLKITVWRKPGGFYAPENTDPEYLIQSKPFTEAPAIKNKAGISKTVRNLFSGYSHLKTTNALRYVLAGIEKKENGWDDIILTDEKGNISEALNSNIYWIKENTIYTPSLESGCIAGTSLKNIKKVIEPKGIKCLEGLYKLPELLHADVVFTSNAGGISTLQNIEGKEFFSNHAIVNVLKKELLF